MSTYIVTPTPDQEKLIADFLEEQHISFIKDESINDLPQHVLDGIARGRAEIAAGNFITHEEFKKRIGVV
ncbi:hypothetical protein EWM62_08225 [Mucilaginibacter terrigena]|uniref:Uncharacterized protein n=1 Tax=Mucilaginibacter terrigena TaxID=2492395 RepID=A0A4Q5LNJ7_9SPHI|nr:hypothetical protein [Mucilaginibacter terrigena]RYU90629.1 hypothetical protein EWM62_08225 [Mucilaginibacter terrigena]